MKIPGIVRSHFIEASDTKGVALLNGLQKVILPDDRPADVGLGWWWVIEMRGQPAGFCGLHPSMQWGDAGYLCRSGVCEQFRGNGLQRKMIQLRERAARRLGYRWLLSDTARWNLASANSLAGCGFRLYEPSRPWSFKDSLYWRKAVK